MSVAISELMIQDVMYICGVINSSFFVFISFTFC